MFVRITRREQYATQVASRLVASAEARDALGRMNPDATTRTPCAPRRRATTCDAALRQVPERYRDDGIDRAESIAPHTIRVEARRTPAQIGETR